MNFKLATKLIPISDTPVGQTWSDINGIKNTILFAGWSFVGLILFEIWRDYKSGKNKTQEKLDKLIEITTRMDERLNKVEEGAISTTDIQTLIREEIEHELSFRRRDS